MRMQKWGFGKWILRNGYFILGPVESHRRCVTCLSFFGQLGKPDYLASLRHFLVIWKFLRHYDIFLINWLFWVLCFLWFAKEMLCKCWAEMRYCSRLMDGMGAITSKNAKYDWQYKKSKVKMGRDPSNDKHNSCNGIYPNTSAIEQLKKSSDWDIETWDLNMHHKE